MIETVIDDRYSYIRRLVKSRIADLEFELGIAQLLDNKAADGSDELAALMVQRERLSAELVLAKNAKAELDRKIATVIAAQLAGERTADATEPAAEDETTREGGRTVE